MRIFKMLLFLAVIVCTVSCGTQRRVANNYLETVADTSVRNLAALPEPFIKVNDQLSIRVYSASIDPAVDAPYNLPESVSGGTVATTGFLVDESGNIEFPRLGTIKAEGLTKNQLADMIRKKLEGQLKQPTVVVRFLNYRVTVLGEVRTPGTFNVPTERITVLEALGLAGDVTEYGKRNNVKVLRENNGSREIATLDLTKNDMFNSPYYRLQQNDVVLVEAAPLRARQREQQSVAQQIGIATSIITAIALILNFLK